MWLGERITDRGIGNGVSMIIMIGIIAALPGAFSFEIQSQLSNNGLILFIFELVILFLTIIASILVVQGVRKIPIQFAKRMVGRGGGAMPVQTDRDYICLLYTSRCV